MAPRAEIIARGRGRGLGALGSTSTDRTYYPSLSETRTSPSTTISPFIHLVDLLVPPFPRTPMTPPPRPPPHPRNAAQHDADQGHAGGDPHRAGTARGCARSWRELAGSWACCWGGSRRVANVRREPARGRPDGRDWGWALKPLLCNPGPALLPGEQRLELHQPHRKEVPGHV